jgi:beta-lactamase regulating signal transducer with metallopeptidase domain
MISWAIETLVASTLLMLVVLAVRRPVARHFGPHIAYGLWLLPALRMLLPPLPETVTPAPIHVLPANVEALLAAAAMLHTDTGVAAVEAPSINWLLLFGCAWAAGALVFLGWHIWTYRRFVRTALDDATQLPRFDRGRIEVCASPAARGPFAAGIFLKTVVLPEDYRRRYEQDELRLAIEHEVQHHRRCDMSANFAALVVLALHWWNPIAHFAHRAFRVDQELACDALVLAQATPFERHAYGSALLKSACDRLPVAACALGAGDDLKRRLTMMKIYRWNASRARLGTMIATGLVGGGLLLTASNGIAAETTKRVEQKVRTILPVAVPETPPEPPAPPPAPRAPLSPTAPAAPDAPLPPPPPPAMPAMPAMPPVPASLVSISWSSNGQDRMLDPDEIREIQESAREARREALAAAREAQADAMEAARDAAAEAREAAREAVRVHPVVVTRNCPKGTPFMAKVSDDGNTQVLCGAYSPVDRAKLRRQIIASLEQTRASLAASLNDEWARRTREEALAGIDREIARLKSEK